MVMSTRADFPGPLGREFVVSYTLWLFRWHQDQLTESDIESAIDQCLFECWLRIVSSPLDDPTPQRSVCNPPLLDWTSHGLALAKKIFGDKHVQA